MRQFKHYVIAFLFLLVLIFVIQNWEPVSITFLFWSLELPRLVLVALLLLIGFVTGALVFGSAMRRSPTSEGKDP